MGHMKKVLILGAYGYLGGYLSQHLESLNFEVFRQGRSENSQIRLDIFNGKDFIALLEKECFDCIVNLIALTDVEFCELNPEIARRINEFSVLKTRQSIDVLPEEKRPHLLHISTDQVYEGEGPHIEESVNPINVYGKTKLLGEKYAIPLRSTVLRVNFIGKSRFGNRQSLSDWIVSAAKNLKPTVVFEDVIFSPLHVSTLCYVIGLAIKNPIFGIFNLGSSSSMSKADYAFKLVDQLGLPSNMFTRGSVKNGSNIVRRPQDMSLNVLKIQKELNIVLPEFDHEININAREYKGECNKN